MVLDTAGLAVTVLYGAAWPTPAPGTPAVRARVGPEALPVTVSHVIIDTGGLVLRGEAHRVLLVVMMVFGGQGRSDQH